MDFCTETVVNSFATHVRLYRNAKERMRKERATDVSAYFFDVEAEYEQGICRDEVCMDKDKEKGSDVRCSNGFERKVFACVEFLRDIVEVLIYILLPANEFRCVPARVLIRVRWLWNWFCQSIFVIFQEVVINLGLIPFIDMYSDPDAINQLIIKMVRN